MARGPTERALRAEIRRLWGTDRRVLRDAVAQALVGRSRFEDFGTELRRAAGRAVGDGCGLFDEVMANPGDPKLDWWFSGDASWEYDVVLNREAGRYLDGDRRLAMRCGGVARICRVWVSMLLPYYALDTSTIAYSRRHRWYELAPFRPVRRDDRLVVRRVRAALGASGWSELPRRLEGVRVRDAHTDVHREGSATFFDCLFDDASSRQTERVRFGDDRVADPLTGGSRYWETFYDGRGRMTRREFRDSLPSNESVVIHADGQDRITRVKVFLAKPHQALDFDIAKRRASATPRRLPVRGRR